MNDSTKIAAEVVSAYVSKNAVPAGELPDLVRAVAAAFAELDQ